ncbi:MAG: hypothetical protein LJE97_07380 [Betaproteobacteria bacterium]|jgi:hypothetical protein|nr:hypothetical protein [Betaproteobacteria bacterium]
MPFNWIAAFKIIPWTDVIAAAPTVARTARDLWRGISKTRPTETVEARDDVETAGTPPSMEEEIRSLRAELAETRAQLLSSSEVLRALADQDEKLVGAIEVLRVRTRVLAIVCVALVAACVMLLLR